MKQKLLLYLKIFITLWKISFLTFGGGTAILPLLYHEISKKNNWMAEDEVTEIYTISQVIPGLIYVSSATFIGYRLAGILGAVLATAAVLIPSAVSILVLIVFFQDFFNNALIKHVFAGILLGVAVLILNTGISLYKNSVKGFYTFILFIISLICLEFYDIKPFILIIAGIILGLIYLFILNKKGSKNNV